MTAHAAIKNTFFEDFFVQKCLTIIVNWWKKAAEQGLKEAVEALKKIESNNKKL